MTEPDNSRVTYGIKELLQDIKGTVIRLDTKLDNKADKADVAVLVQQQHTQDRAIESLTFRISALEQHRQDARDQHRFRLPLFISLGLNLVNPFLWYAVYHIHG